MDINIVRGGRGQISIEFILIVLIALVYIYSVIQPTVRYASQSAEDVARLSQAKFAAQKLAAAINQLQTGGSDGKKTMMLFVPKSSFIECSGDRINFNATMSNLRLPPQCTAAVCDQGCIVRDSVNECKGFIRLISGANPYCDFGGTPQGKIDASTNNVFNEVSVTKDSTGISVAYAS